MQYFFGVHFSLYIINRQRLLYCIWRCIFKLQRFQATFYDCCLQWVLSSWSPSCSNIEHVVPFFKLFNLSNRAIHCLSLTSLHNQKLPRDLRSNLLSSRCRGHLISSCCWRYFSEEHSSYWLEEQRTFQLELEANSLCIGEDQSHRNKKKKRKVT